MYLRIGTLELVPRKEIINVSIQLNLCDKEMKECVLEYHSVCGGSIMLIISVFSLVRYCGSLA